MTEPNKPNDAGSDKKNLLPYIVPAGAVAAIVVLVGLVIAVSGSWSRKMSDGSDGTASDPGLKELAPGVRYRDLKEGQGEACPPGATATLHYTGWLENGDVFESTKETVANPRPGKFVLSEALNAKWREGVPGMKPGGIRKLVVAPEKGYGINGNPPKIPGNSTLIFELELVEFVPPLSRRVPPPSDLTKLSDGTAPGADDPGLRPLGNSGLLYRDIKEGGGPVCPNGANIVVDYTGWLLSGGEPFDTSWKPNGTPFEASLKRGLIEGWQQGIPGMKVGGIRKLVIPPGLAYGAKGQGSIPPNSTLVFEIDLLGI